MNHKSKRILAIETSCDETAAAVIDFDMKSMEIRLLSNVVYSQIDLHKKYGGVYPELASRAHIEKIRSVVGEALAAAQVTNEHLTSNVYTSKHPVDAIAVTVGPGLAGSLIVGVEFARGLAASLNLPVIPVNHLEGHIFASYASSKSNLKNQISKLLITEPEFPALALVVSGGHTMLILMKKHLNYKIIGTTVDDAAGECFDKVARMLGLPYSGGPALSKLAEGSDPKAYNFPRAMIKNDDYNFSFSGLKTAVFYKLRELGLVNEKAEPIPPARVASEQANKCKVPEKNPHLSPVHLTLVTCSPDTKASIAASAQAAIVDVLVAKTLRAAADINAKSILVGGGVAANSALRAEFAKLNVKSEKLNVSLTPVNLATDNALSIALAAAYHYRNGDISSWHTLEADASLRLQ